MEKISGILPSSPRLRSVDLSESGAVRPSAPTFGRPVGISTLSQQVAASAVAMDRTQLDRTSVPTGTLKGSETQVQKMFDQNLQRRQVDRNQQVTELQNMKQIDYSQPNVQLDNIDESLEMIAKEIPMDGTAVNLNPVIDKNIDTIEMDVPERGRFVNVRA